MQTGEMWVSGASGEEMRGPMNGCIVWLLCSLCDEVAGVQSVSVRALFIVRDCISHRRGHDSKWRWMSAAVNECIEVIE